MKSTKTLLIAALVAGALLAGSSALRAQDATNMPPVHKMKERQSAVQALNLTADQQPKFQAIMKDAMEKRKALREDTSSTPEEKKAKAKEILDGMNTQMKALLTPEQFVKWQDMSKHKVHGHPPMIPGSQASPKTDPTAPPN
jgi:Spy/CpxP family protein refolding chaperone